MAEPSLLNTTNKFSLANKLIESETVWSCILTLKSQRYVLVMLSTEDTKPIISDTCSSFKISAWIKASVEDFVEVSEKTSLNQSIP